MSEYILNRIESGRQMIEILEGVNAIRPSIPEMDYGLHKTASIFLDKLIDHMEVLSSMTMVDRSELEQELSQDVDQLENSGLYVYAKKLDGFTGDKTRPDEATPVKMLTVIVSQVKDESIIGVS